MCMYAHTVIRLTFWENYTVEVHANITFYPVCAVFTRNIPKQVMAHCLSLPLIAAGTCVVTSETTLWCP